MTQAPFRLKFEPGQKRMYNLSSNVRQHVSDAGRVLSKEEHSYSASLEQKVLAVEPDGSAHVVSVTVPNPPIPAGAPPKSLVYEHLDARGQLLESSGPSQASAFSFPEEAVDVGSTWKGVSQGHVPNNPEPVKMGYTYKLEGFEERVGRQCAKISFNSEEVEFQVPSPDGRGQTKIRTSTSGTMYFALDGYLVRLELTTKTFPEMGQARVEIINELTQELAA